MTVRTFFDDAVAANGAKTFLRAFDGAAWQAMTYADVRRNVIAACAVLLKIGLTDAKENGYRTRVAIMRENSPEWVVLYLALAGSGFIVVPVDPKLRPTEAEHILLDSGAAVVFSDVGQDETLAATKTRARKVTDVEFRALLAALTEEEIAAAEKWWEEHRPETDDIASIVYTSGTTGKPKGAMLSHGNFTANVDQTFSRVMFYESDHFLLVLPLFHVFAFTLSFLMPLRKQAEISFARSMRSVGPDMAALKPTVFMAVPLLAEILYAHAREIVCKLRVLGVGGAPISKETLNGLLSAGVFVLEGYGITECAPGVSYPDEHRYVPGTVGTPLDGMEWRITESDETGAGELRVKGPNVMKGYWNNPVETAKAFDADGFYRTGDIVRPILNGNFTICGRTKALIVNREGKNIYPEEIERAIGTCPCVKEVIVIGYRVGGEVGERVGAIVVPDLEAAALKAEPTREKMIEAVRRDVQDRCHELLAEYKWPRKVDIRFVSLERTPSMKVKRFIYARALDE